MFIDSHCHIPHHGYDKPPEDIIDEAQKEGIGKIITIGTSVKDNIRTLETAVKYDSVYSSIGIYPTDDPNKGLDRLKNALEETYAKYKQKIVAVGETGIEIPKGYTPVTSAESAANSTTDSTAVGETTTVAESGNGWKARSLKDQEELFLMQIEFALAKNLPIIIHNRNGNETVLNALNQYKSRGLKGVLHCFVQDWEFAQKALDLGFYISFSGIITFKNAGAGLLDTVKKVPSDKYIIETDAPYIAPHPYRGNINYPKYVKITAEKVAELRNISLADVENGTYKNTCNLFNL